MTEQEGMEHANEWAVFYNLARLAARKQLMELDQNGVHYVKCIADDFVQHFALSALRMYQGEPPLFIGAEMSEESVDCEKEAESVTELQERGMMFEARIKCNELAQRFKLAQARVRADAINMGRAWFLSEVKGKQGRRIEHGNGLVFGENRRI